MANDESADDFSIPHIVVIGGGYASLKLVKKLKSLIKKGKINVTIICKTNYHSWHGFIGEMLTGRIQPGQLLSPVRRIFTPAKIHVGTVHIIDEEKKIVTVSRDIDGKQYDVNYDELVITLGTTDNSASYPGLKEHGFRLKKYDDCLQARSQIIRMFELASISDDEKERKELLTFFVAGGGYSGTEVAGEIADFVRLLCKYEFKEINRSEAKVVLVHSGDNLLPELQGHKSTMESAKSYPKLISYAERHVQKLGVDLMLGKRVAAVTPRMVELSDGERIPTRTVISVVGNIAHSLIANHPSIPTNERGKIIITPELKVQGMENIWACGDCASVPHIKGGYCPSNALFAMHQGKHLAKNLKRTLVKNKEGVKFNYKGLGQGVSIGRRTAVGELKGIQIKGKFAWIAWRWLLWQNIPTWDRRWRLLADWLIWPLVGRDIVDMSVKDSDDFEIKKVIYQPDEMIVVQGEMGHSLTLITEGKVDIWRDIDLDGIPDIEKTVSRGEWIGADPGDGIVRFSAKTSTMVKGFQVRIDEAENLKDMVSLLESVHADDGTEDSKTDLSSNKNQSAI